MTVQRRVYVDFQEVKRVVPLPEVLQAFGVFDQFQEASGTFTGVCPLPQHQHGPYPNPEQFKATVRDGVWVWHCFGDCQRGGCVVEFVKLMAGLDNRSVRHWFAAHFGNRLTLSRPRDGTNGRRTEKKEAREAVQEPQRANVTDANENLPTSAEPIKPLRFSLKLQSDVTYLRQRGLSEETIARYGLGLCTKGMLKGYVAIPVYGHPKAEHPLAYLGRWPGEDYDEAEGRPRYKWPGGFPKQRVVYGLSEALETPDDTPLICVEGPFGVYRVAQAGFASAVAVFGSSLSDDQAAILAETGRPVVLMFDGDEAGRAGMRKAAGKLIGRSFVRVATLPDCSEPEDLDDDALGDLLSFS